MGVRSRVCGVHRCSGSGKGTQQAVPAEPPAGTDPALWCLLSTEERGFFAKAGAMGPLSFGRPRRDMPAAQIPPYRRGRRDDQHCPVAALRGGRAHWCGLAARGPVSGWHGAELG